MSKCSVCGRGKNTIANALVDLGDGVQALMCTECSGDQFRRKRAREIALGLPRSCCERCDAKAQRGRA